MALPQAAAEVLPDPIAKKLPVGNTVSSIHVNYNYFEVGTGQVGVIVKEDLKTVDLTGC